MKKGEIISVLIVFSILFFTLNSTLAYAWWDTDWKLGAQIKFSHNDGAHTNEPIIVNVSNVSCAQSLKQDLRVVKDNITLLGFSWVNYPEVIVFLADSTNNDAGAYWIYCSNPNAANASNEDLKYVDVYEDETSDWQGSAATVITENAPQGNKLVQLGGPISESGIGVRYSSSGVVRTGFLIRYNGTGSQVSLIFTQNTTASFDGGGGFQGDSMTHQISARHGDGAGNIVTTDTGYKWANDTWMGFVMRHDVNADKFNVTLNGTQIITDRLFKNPTAAVGGLVYYTTSSPPTLLDVVIISETKDFNMYGKTGSNASLGPINYYDTIPPTIVASAQMHVNQTVTNNSWIANFTITDNILLDNTSIEIDSNNYTPTKQDNYYTFSITLTDGNYTVKAYANDTSGNENKHINNWVFINLDTTPAIVTFVSAPLNTTLSQTSVTISITTNESSTSANLEWNGANVSMSGSGTSWSITQSSLADGNYSFKAYATDAAGNTGVSEERWVAIDTTLPSISAPAEMPINKAINYSALVANFTIADNLYLENSSIEIDSINYTPTKQGNYYTYSINLAEGNHTIYVHANDSAGNSVTANSWVFVDTTSPTISSPSPTNNSALAAGTTSTLLQVQTDETAQCKFSNQSGQTFANMDLFNYSNSTTHNITLYNLANGQSYNYYIKCNDTIGNLNTNDYWLRFSVSSGGGGEPGPTGGGGGGGSSTPVCKPTEIIQNGKCVPKPQNKTTASNQGTATVNVLPPVTATETETPETETINAPEVSVAATSPTALLVLQRLKNPYFALLLAGILFGSLTAYAVHSGKLKAPKVPKLSMPKISLPKIKLEPKPQPASRKPQTKFEFPKISLPKFSLPKPKFPEFSLPKFSMPKLKIEKKQPPASPQTKVVFKPNIFVKTPQIDYKKLAKELKPSIAEKKETKKEDFLLIPPKPEKVPLSAPPRSTPMRPTSHMETLISALGEKEEEVIRTLLLHGGRTTMARIFHETGIPPTTLLRWVVSLENRGLIRSTKLGKLRRLEFTDKFLKPPVGE